MQQEFCKWLLEKTYGFSMYMKKSKTKSVILAANVLV